MTCWRCDVAWLTVACEAPSQTKCGICAYFACQMDLAKRNSPTMTFLRNRLGQPFSFQAAQRLVQDRIEEKSNQSEGRVWFMKIDRMDQVKTTLPEVWTLRASSLMKLGARLVTSIIGSKWSGTQNLHYLLRSNFLDFRHGADTQCSAILENLHYVATQTGSLPEEWVIGADNTVKETKNNTFIHFCLWLLSTMRNTRLKSMVFTALITGHTHDSLDRFFALLRASLRGHDYFSLEEMFDIVKRALSSKDNIAVAHVAQAWKWSEMFEAEKLPRIHDLARIHVFNIFSHTTGLWIKWKQYMSDITWSRPVITIPVRKMR